MGKQITHEFYCRNSAKMRNRSLGPKGVIGLIPFAATRKRPERVLTPVPVAGKAEPSFAFDVK